MRQYATNSPEAMARIIALSMLVDGGLDKSELDVIARYGVLERLAMSEQEFEKIVHVLCEDMLQCVPGINHGQIELDEASIDSILSDIQDHQLRKTLLGIMLAVVDADERMSDGEAILITRAMECWALDLIEVREIIFSNPETQYRDEQAAYASRKSAKASAQFPPSPPSILATHY
ncbi:TerB family tellurite resistance protein [Undibacterium fentianense]|uniref:TerB family tellurite resistance protein n=1 Tax=Undibacterium fentianense TaxID=2828728 RepID=A0A941IFN3_9BURK|nr:TerB family tellurite resistance protein [Undibacterium fentianense]MBR7800537.1 TerB family tellurite resistance protein [Undibacterium fentianense]